MSKLIVLTLLLYVHYTSCGFIDKYVTNIINFHSIITTVNS